MKRVVLLLLFIISLLFSETNSSDKTELSITQKSDKIKEYNSLLSEINKKLDLNVWYAKYTNHKIYLEFKKELEKIEKNMEKLRKRDDEKLEEKRKGILNKMHLLDEFKESPFNELLNPQIPQEIPTVKSPFDMVSAFSYLKILKSTKELYQDRMKTFLELILLLRNKRKYIQKLYEIEKTKNYEKKLQDIANSIKETEEAYDCAKNTLELFNKKLNDDKLKITNDIKIQVQKLINVAIMIAIIFIISFMLKLVVKKTISDNERYYMANKFINFTNLILILVILLFSFLENVSYLVTVIGFASAGIAIAMKDLFMSLLGWTVIVFGGSFHVGDRIKVTREGKSFVGDIVDISFLRMTILEDITYTTLMENHRAGRMIFVPNNYIFTDVLANYTHGKIKTVWDEIDIVVTFDSNYQKAVHLVKEIVKKYSKGYTEISRRQLNLLRNQYSLKNINVEPRVYTFIEDYGIKIASWYMTNSYATLTLRSSISASILEALNNQDDIQLAYPTQVINYKKDKNIPIAPKDIKDNSEKSLS
jgi:small-conductance mechanosensitive channel